MADVTKRSRLQNERFECLKRIGDAEAAFRNILRAQGGSAGNQSLRTTLGWDESIYDQVKTSLIARNLISPGRGRGGSVSLADSS